MSLAQSTYCVHFPNRIGIWKCWFLRRGEKPKYPEKKPLVAKTRTNNKLNPHTVYDDEFGNRIRATLVGGVCSHHFTIPAPCKLIDLLLVYLMIVAASFINYWYL